MTRHKTGLAHLREVSPDIEHLGHLTDHRDSADITHTDHDPLSAFVLTAGRCFAPGGHAEALNTASGGRLARAGAAFVALQRQYGNRYVQRVVDRAREIRATGRAPVAAAKLSVRAPDGRHEREADRVAQQVTGRPVVRRAPHAADGPSAEVSAAGAEVQRAIDQARGGGRAMPGALRTEMEGAFGADFGRVRLHTDARADQLSRSLEAEAFTIGRDVFFRRGAYGPDSQRGRELMAHELTHVVQQDATPAGQAAVVQRYVPAGAGNKRHTAASLLAKFQKDHPQGYAEATAQGMDDNAIKLLFQPHIDSPNLVYLANVFNELLELIEHRKTEARFAPDVEERGVAVQVLTVSHNFSIPLQVVEQNNAVDLHPERSVIMEAKVAVRLPGDELGDWSIGITQTVFSGLRRAMLVNTSGGRLETVEVLKPHNDRRAASTPPWYDTNRGKVEPTKTFEILTVLLDDRPGFSFNLAADDKLLKSSGRDVFATWLILRNNTDGTVRYLYEWAWQLEYKAGGRGAWLRSETANPTGEGATLAGPRATDPGEAATDPEEFILPTPAKYREMKTLATKATTIGSGMMSKATYADLYAQYATAVYRREYPRAVTVLEQMKTNLDKMGRKGTEYWKTEELRQEQYLPLRNTIVRLLAQIRSELGS